MKRSLFLLAILGFSTNVASADCYVPADARGSFAGRAAYDQPSLCSFGEESYDYEDVNYVDGWSDPSQSILTVQEQRKVIRDLQSRYRTGRNDGILRRAVQGATEPAKRLPPMPVIVKGQ